MLFNSVAFWVFFPIVFGLYSILSHRWQNRALLLASYVFYGWWDPRFLSLIFVSTLVDFGVGLKLQEESGAASRKRWLVLSLVTNLGLLCAFKYFGFFADSARVVIETLGLTVGTWELGVILPVGISFYTFQTISYTVGVYRGKVRATRSFLDFALFVAFFPQLVAGPIERAGSLLPQIQKPRTMSWERWSEGALLVGLGLFKKVAVADSLAPLVEQAFSDPAHTSAGSLIFGLYCFSFQVYADFSGYTDVARGISRALGFDLMVNFEQPFFSGSVAEFWRRWHISLSTWLRDYLYIPLGGNRLGRLKTLRNLFITMLLGGLWHGAAWTFVAWGALHGLFLVIHRVIKREAGPSGRLVRFLKVVATFHLVTLSFVLFRSETFGDALAYFRGIVTLQDGEGFTSLDSRAMRAAVLLVLTLVLLIDVPQALRRSQTALLEWSLPRRVMAYAVLVLVALSLTDGSWSEFIYFQF